MAARPYSPSPALAFANGTTAGIVEYQGSESTTPLMPILPDFRDTETAHRFYSNLTSLITKDNPHWEPVPRKVDEKMFITFGVGVEPCGGNNSCANPLGPQYRFSANMNNVSFLTPTRLSMAEAYYHGVEGIYTEDFPNNPPTEFNYTDPRFEISFPNPVLAPSSLPLVMIEKKETRVKRLKFGSVVDVVLQNTALLAAENHPMHFHGFDFYVLAQGFGNYDPINDPKKYNLVNPQERNTIGVPLGGWAAIRFKAINPGMWLPYNFQPNQVFPVQNPQSAQHLNLAVNCMYCCVSLCRFINLDLLKKFSKLTVDSGFNKVNALIVTIEIFRIFDPSSNRVVMHNFYDSKLYFFYQKKTLCFIFIYTHMIYFLQPLLLLL
ncbi:laccase [Ranunculus cassubicifolius]